MKRFNKIIIMIILLLGVSIVPIFASFYAKAQLEARVIALKSWEVDAEGIVRIGAEIQMQKLLNEGGHAKMGDMLVGQRVTVVLILDSSVKALKNGDRFVVEWSTFNSMGPNGVVEGTSYRVVSLL